MKETGDRHGGGGCRITTSSARSVSLRLHRLAAALSARTWTISQRSRFIYVRRCLPTRVGSRSCSQGKDKRVTAQDHQVFYTGDEPANLTIRVRSPERDYVRSQSGAGVAFRGSLCGIGAKLQHGFGQIAWTLPEALSRVQPWRWPQGFERGHSCRSVSPEWTGRLDSRFETILLCELCNPRRESPAVHPRVTQVWNGPGRRPHSRLRPCSL